jgi:hypothetical protein
MLEKLLISSDMLADIPESIGNLINLHTLAALKHLPYITVVNPTTRKLPAAFKKRPDFYHDGDKRYPRISAESWDGNGITVDRFAEPSPAGMVFQRIAHFFRACFGGGN